MIRVVAWDSSCGGCLARADGVFAHAGAHRAVWAQGLWVVGILALRAGLQEEAPIFLGILGVGIGPVDELGHERAVLDVLAVDPFLWKEAGKRAIRAMSGSVTWLVTSEE